MSAPSIFTLTLGDKLRKARDMAGLSQQELARRLHLSRNTVASYERVTGDDEASIPNRWILRGWAEVCGIDYADLGLPHPPTEGERDDGGTTHRETLVAWLMESELLAA